MSENFYADDYNPFQAPENPYDPEGLASSSAVATRRKYLSHEASVKSIGTLYLLGGILCVIAGPVLLWMNLQGAREAPSLAIGGIVLVLGIVQSVTAFGLQKLRPWARIISGILSGIGLFAIGVPTLINAYILYLLFCPKGRMVFSEEYREVMEQTPEIKYRTSIIVWIFLVLLLTLILAGFVFAFTVG